MEAREKHMENLNKVGAQGDQIDEITRMGHETKDTATGIAKKMRTQRDHIISAIEHTNEANRNVQDAKTLLNTISRKEFFYKLLLYCLVIVLFIVILGIMLHKIQ